MSGAQYRCPRCGGTEVEGTTWVDLNTNAIVDGEPPTDQYWCRDCHESSRSVCQSDGSEPCRLHHAEDCAARWRENKENPDAVDEP